MHGFLKIGPIFMGLVLPLVAHPQERIQDRIIDHNEMSCEQLLDIRSFSQKRKAKFDQRFSYDIALKAVNDVSHLHITVQPHVHKGADVILVNIIEHANTGLQGSTANLVIGLFADLFADSKLPGTEFFRNGGKHYRIAILKDMYNADLEKRLKGLISVLEKDLLPPIEAPALYLNPKNDSDRVVAIRQILANFLKEHKVATELLFFHRYLGYIHRDFLNSLDSQETSMLHYSIFDKDIGFEARHEMEQRLQSWKDAGATRYASVDDFVIAMWERMIQMSERFRKTYDKYIVTMRDQRMNAASRALQMHLYSLNLRDQIQILNAKIAKLEATSTAEERASRSSEIGKTYRETIRERNWRVGRKNLADHNIRRRQTLMSDSEKKTYAELESWGGLNVSGNYNAYSFDVDHPVFWRKPKFKLEIIKIATRGRAAKDAIEGTAFDGSASVSASVNRLNDPFARSEWGDRLVEVSAADSTLALSETGLDEDMVVLLNSLGIRRVYEITNYSAQDYIDRFHVSPEKFQQLLDELNFLGIHLHFDSEWDRSNLRIRKQRPEYYEHRHTPRLMGKWRDAPSGSDDVDRQTRRSRDGEWN